MGLRSRQRRLAGEKPEDSFDVETSQRRSATLQEHLQASRRDIDEANLTWKNSVGTGGLIMMVYEGGLYLQTLAIPMHAPVSPLLCLVFKILAVISIYVSREYVLSGSHKMFGASIVAIAVYALLWAATFWIFALRFTLLQVSPTPIVYFVAAHAVAKLIGGNTKAEIARAQQLEKLERVSKNLK